MKLYVRINVHGSAGIRTKARHGWFFSHFEYGSHSKLMYIMFDGFIILVSYEFLIDSKQTAKLAVMSTAVKQFVDQSIIFVFEHKTCSQNSKQPSTKQTWGLGTYYLEGHATDMEPVRTLVDALVEPWSAIWEVTYETLKITNHDKIR